ncbi:hypothetical protein IWX50DRAFT_617298 [Phyllosticta citricarpa]|uniref:Uncharacterized protein n=1 Tax=Phyllosticta citricarpa TaxID=55181 RepID=A0ABR1M5X1_9PEZI
MKMLAGRLLLGQPAKCVHKARRTCKLLLLLLLLLVEVKEVYGWLVGRLALADAPEEEIDESDRGTSSALCRTTTVWWERVRHLGWVTASLEAWAPARTVAGVRRGVVVVVVVVVESTRLQCPTEVEIDKGDVSCSLCARPTQGRWMRTWLMGGQIGPRRVACPIICLPLVGLRARLACLAHEFGPRRSKSNRNLLLSGAAALTERFQQSGSFALEKRKKNETEKAHVVGRMLQAGGQARHMHCVPSNVAYKPSFLPPQPPTRHIRGKSELMTEFEKDKFRETRIVKEFVYVTLRNSPDTEPVCAGQ